MLKKTLYIIVLLALVLTVAACTPATEAPTEPPKEEATEAIAEEAPEEAGDVPKVALIIAQGGLGDRSYNDLAYSGLQKAAEDFSNKNHATL